MALSVWGDLAVAGAGVLAGGINTIVGSGSLITFPTLVALGLPPLVANVTNTVGLVPGSVSGAWGYRRELAGQRGRAIRLGIFSALGGLAGGILLLSLPGSFQEVVPWLVLLAVAMVVVQPRLARWLADRGRAPEGHGGWLLRGGVFTTGVYGGYFGAAQGVLLIGILGLGVDDDLQRLNALKNVLAALVNGVAGVLFIVDAPVRWEPALILAAGSIAGGQLGARVGRRLPAAVLRGVIVIGGVAVAVKLLV
ncbi:MAG: sulfite exporter TauE/SafE family protein [Acidimicrobiales bacterium]